MLALNWEPTHLADLARYLLILEEQREIRAALRRGMTMIQPVDVQQLLAHWWFAYDNALFDEWPALWASNAHFSCRSDTGQTAFEEFVTADAHGLDAVIAWQTDHRMHSPHPLRHGGENIHIMSATESAANFRSYIRVSQIVEGKVSHLSTGIVHGSVTTEDGVLRIADLNVVLDTEDSTVLATKEVRQAGPAHSTLRMG